jgi:shikimate kinase
MTRRHVALVGLMAVGKTTVGRELAARLDRPIRDNDDELLRRTGATPAELNRTRGIDELHAEEAVTAKEMLAGHEPAVVTIAASAVADAAVRAALEETAFVVWLHAGPDVLVDRLADPGVRPEFAASLRDMVGNQARERDEWFRDVADADFDTSASTPDEIAAAIAARREIEVPEAAG